MAESAAASAPGRGALERGHRAVHAVLWGQLLVVLAVLVLTGRTGLRLPDGATPSDGRSVWQVWLPWILLIGAVACATICAALPTDPLLVDSRLTDSRLTDSRLTDSRLTDSGIGPSARAAAVTGGLLLGAAALQDALADRIDLFGYQLVALTLISVYRDLRLLALGALAVVTCDGLVAGFGPSNPDLPARSGGQLATTLAVHAVLAAGVTAVLGLARRSERAELAATREGANHLSRLALVAEHIDASVVITDPAGMIEWVNDSFARITGLMNDEAIGRDRIGLFRGSRQHIEQLAQRLAQAPDGMRVEIATQTPEDQPCWLEVEICPVREGSEVTHLIWTERDVTARHLTAEKLQAAGRRAGRLTAALSAEKALLTGVISTIPHLVYWKDAAGRYRGANQAYLNQRGAATELALVRRAESELPGPDPLADLRSIENQVRSDGQPVTDRQVTVTGADDRRRTLLVSVLPHLTPSGAVDGIIGVGADITHASELEHQLAQANRLESIGQLAAGIAHEINTPVQFVTDNTRYVSEVLGGLGPLIQRGSELATELIAQGADTGGPSGELRTVLAGIDIEEVTTELPSALRESLEGLARVTQIIAAMKDFAHPGQDRADTDINRAVESTCQVCRNEWKYVARLDLDLADGIGPVPCYEGELKQVVLNMIVNAAHAIQERRRQTGSDELGTIRLTTRRLGDTVQIEIEDDGAGMDEATRHRVFDPFFTTKPVGQGTGQGLSLAHASIVGRHRGTISVSSTPGEGSTFTITLPAPAAVD